MVIKTIVTLTDDLNGKTKGVATYQFSLRGTPYEIDLTPENLVKLQTALDPFIKAGRRLPKATDHSQRPRIDGPSFRVGNQRLRDWWYANWKEHKLPEPRSHGGIPRRIRNAYDAVH